MSPGLRNAISVALLAVAVAGAYFEYRAARSGVPGPHQLVIAAYALIAIYAAASLALRMRAGGGR
jgi:hypothetical protein